MSDDLLTDDNILRFTQGQRKKLEAHLLVNGWPTDSDGQIQLMSLWNDMDRQALGNKRIGAAEKMAGADRMVAGVIADVIKQFGSNLPYTRPEGGGLTFDHAPDGAEKLPRVNPVPGELSIGLESENFENFVKKFEDE
ncbi:hypothetical protein D3C71_553340 [compost metagenome]